MKWYKHISDSLDDPFIFDLMTKHGSDGYVVFFGTIEIYSREFKPELSWNLVVSLAFLQQKLRISRNKIKKILQDITKWDIKLSNDQVTIYIPKFTELLDEWTQRTIKKTRESIGSESGVTPEKLETIKNKNKNIEEDKDNPPTPILFPYPAVISGQLWEDFVEHRRVTIRKPLTVKAASIIIRKLEKWKREGHDPTAIVEDAIANGWRGVFEPKNYPQKKKNPNWS